jgi:anti-repressor protein
VNNLIKINYQNDKQTTSARNLWEFLDKPYTKFTMWFDKYKTYGFVENEDYRELSAKTYTSNGASHDATDYEITVDMAKELSMLQKSEKGKIARKYFIALEKQWNSPEAVMSRALKMADSKIMKLESQIEEQKPKVLFAEAVTASHTSILVGDLAKLIKQNGVDIGANRLFEWLRREGYLIKRKGTDYNMPTQKSMDLALFEVKETSITHSDGHISINKTPKVTGKGQIYFINKFIEEKSKKEVACTK